MKFSFLGGVFALALVVSLTSGCDKLNLDDKEENGADQSVSAGVAGLSSAVNAANVSTGGLRTVGCGKSAASDTCTTGLKKADYPEATPCTTEYLKYFGFVNLSYSDTSCSMAANGAKVTQTFSMNAEFDNAALLVLNGRKIKAFSDAATTWDGTNVGGGANLTRDSATAFSVVVDGRTHQLFNKAGKKLSDVSFKTDGAITGTGADPFTGNRTVNGGKLLVWHNLAKYKATFVPVNLTFNKADCCHPNGGTINATYEGSVTGTATIAFSDTCGQVKFTKDGVESTVFLQGCL